MSLDLPSISAVSTEPILFAQVPAFDAMHDKLVSFIDGVPSQANSSEIKDDLAQEIFLWLKQRYVDKSKAPTNPALVSAFGRTIATLVADLPVVCMFPLFDVWRLANRTNNCPSYADAACQSPDSKQRIGVVVTPRDAPYTAASDNGCSRHATFPIPTCRGG